MKKKNKKEKGEHEKTLIKKEIKRSRKEKSSFKDIQKKKKKYSNLLKSILESELHGLHTSNSINLVDLVTQLRYISLIVFLFSLTHFGLYTTIK